MASARQGPPGSRACGRAEATLDDLLTFESAPAGAKPGVEVEQVCNHLDGLWWARRELARPRGLPLSMRLLHGVHRRLMKGAGRASKQPGEVRRSQNWVGGTRPGNAAYVPPPPAEVPRLLGELERYIHAADSLPPLVRAGLVHVQFETIHPYLDGNGRVGRLLVALLLEHWEAPERAAILPEPPLQAAPAGLLPPAERGEADPGTGEAQGIMSLTRERRSGWG